MNMVDTFDQLVNIAQVVRKCPTITLRRAYVRALREWCQQTQWLRINLAGSTTINTRQYALGNDPFLDIVGVYAMQGQQSQSQGIQYWPIVPSDSGQWDPNMVPGMPVRFQYVPEAQFALDPIPSQVYGLLLTLILQPKEGAQQIPESPLIKYSNEIEAGALAYLFDIPGQPWSNPMMGMKYARMFSAGIASKPTMKAIRNVGVVNLMGVRAPSKPSRRRWSTKKARAHRGRAQISRRGLDQHAPQRSRVTRSVSGLAGVSYDRNSELVGGWGLELERVVGGGDQGVTRELADGLMIRRRGFLDAAAFGRREAGTGLETRRFGAGGPAHVWPQVTIRTIAPSCWNVGRQSGGRSSSASSTSRNSGCSMVNSISWWSIPAQTISVPIGRLRICRRNSGVTRKRAIRI